MDKVHILVEGYAHAGKDDKHFHASPSTALVYSKGKKVIIDPGADRAKLLKALKKEKLKPKDIDTIFLTHWHPDHFLNIRLFPDNDIMDATTHWMDTGEEHFPEGELMSKIPGTNIKILPTPGHREEHVSLLVETKDGIICIAEDVFWWIDGEQPENPTQKDLLNLKDPFKADEKILITSRKKVLKVADWIIPGHGKMFKNPSRK